MSTSKQRTGDSNAIQMSTDMKKLLEHQYQINIWLMQAEQKIYQLEEAYLLDTPLGNIVRGWGDIEANQKTHQRSRGAVDDRERIFSSSSLLDKSLAAEFLNISQPAKKKTKKPSASTGKSEKDPSKFRKMLFDDGDTSAAAGITEGDILSNAQFDNSSQLEMDVFDEI